MTKSLVINTRGLTIWLFAGIWTTNLLVWLAHNVDGWLLSALLFACLVLLPGLALLRITRITLRSLLLGIVYAFGLGLLALMLSGLAANQLWPLFGVERPLELPGALAAWNIMTLGLIIAAAYVNRKTVRLMRRPMRHVRRQSWTFIGATLFLPVLATLGAVRLNNGGDALLAQLAIGYAAGLIGMAIYWRHKLSSEVLGYFIFVLGLSVLLMTSMRGWDIVGHDIEREFRVFTLTQLEGRWDIALYRDPYNACLSITILPQMLTRLLDMSGVMVFKVVLQVVFAVCPVIIFLLIRRYASKLAALIGTLLFICYPTFVSNSAMLTRQGVAYLFFALAILIISNKIQTTRSKLLFLLCSLGAILSHYSTAYMFVGLFAVAVICKVIMTWRQGYRPWPWRSRVKATVLSPLFALLLFLMTFGWYARITDTSGGLSSTLISSIANIPHLFSGNDKKSSDTSAALMFSGGRTPAELYSAYVRQSADTHTGQLPMPSLTDDTMPLTALGQKVKSLGFNPSTIAELRQHFAKVLQVLGLLGVLYVAYRIRKKTLTLGVDCTYLNLAGLIVLALMVVLPVLSVNYGMLRAFQQSLIFLVLPIALFLARLGEWLRPSVRTRIAGAGIVGLFILFTGLFAQLLGGSSPALSMNNQGLYYGLYYAPASDRATFSWLKQHLPKEADVRAANFNRALMHDPEYPFSKNGLLPTQLKPETTVYLDHAQIQEGRFYVYYESSPLIMTFPLQYFDATRDRIYSTASGGIYR